MSPITIENSFPQNSDQQPAPNSAATEEEKKLTQISKPSVVSCNGSGDPNIPSSEKKDWCRNEKYIQSVPNGFICTICQKFYERYNSISYHVTIYHRNPSIKCDEPGCQYTSREARYIHFHKYYKHNIAPPESIDLDCNGTGEIYECPQCSKQLNTQRDMYDHMLTHLEVKN